MLILHFPMVFLWFFWFSYGNTQQPPASPFELPASGTAQGGFAVPLRTLRALRAGATGPVELGRNGGSGWCWYILMVNVKCIKYIKYIYAITIYSTMYDIYVWHTCMVYNGIYWYITWLDPCMMLNLPYIYHAWPHIYHQYTINNFYHAITWLGYIDGIHGTPYIAAPWILWDRKSWRKIGTYIYMFIKGYISINDIRAKFCMFSYYLCSLIA